MPRSSVRSRSSSVGSSPLGVERSEPAAKRHAGPALPVVAAHDARVRLDVVRARDHDDVLHRARAERREHVREQQALLRRAVARRRARREHDRRYDVSTLTLEMTTFWVGCSFVSPSAPIRSTTSSPCVTLPTIA